MMYKISPAKNHRCTKNHPRLRNFFAHPIFLLVYLYVSFCSFFHFRLPLVISFHFRFESRSLPVSSTHASSSISPISLFSIGKVALFCTTSQSMNIACDNSNSAAYTARFHVFKIMPFTILPRNDRSRSELQESRVCGHTRSSCRKWTLLSIYSLNKSLNLRSRLYMFVLFPPSATVYDGLKAVLSFQLNTLLGYGGNQSIFRFHFQS